MCGRRDAWLRCCSALGLAPALLAKARHIIEQAGNATRQAVSTAHAACRQSLLDAVAVAERHARGHIEWLTVQCGMQGRLSGLEHDVQACFDAPAKGTADKLADTMAPSPLKALANHLHAQVQKLVDYEVSLSDRRQRFLQHTVWSCPTKPHDR